MATPSNALQASQPGPRRASATDRLKPGRPPGDDWPHTTRLLPWLLAGFLVMLWLVPFDSVDLPVNLPVDPKLDRFFLAAIAVAWVMSVVVAGPRSPRFRSSAVNAAVLAFFAIALASVLLNLETLVNLGEVGLATKKLALLVSYIVFFFVVATVIRPSELWNFAVLTVVLACITAVGLVWEYRTGFNAFYEWTAAVLPDSINVGAAPGDPKWGRPSVTGPTFHALAAATMLSIALPFAFISYWRSEERRGKLLSALAIGLILAGTIATIRKTGAVAPAAALLTLLVMRPRAMLRLLPLGLVILLFIQLLAPGALVRIKAQFVGGSFTNAISQRGRTADYPAIQPDVRKYPLLGRGYGTYDRDKYRTLDNEYLGVLVEGGVLGLATYLIMVITVMAVGYGILRSRDPIRGPPALAAAAAAAAYGVASSTFDVIAFPHAPYLFFFVAGVAVVASHPRRVRAEAPARRQLPWPGRYLPAPEARPDR
jgi:O-antigen ligase